MDKTIKEKRGFTRTILALSAGLLMVSASSAWAGTYGTFNNLDISLGSNKTSSMNTNNNSSLTTGIAGEFKLLNKSSATYTDVTSGFNPLNPSDVISDYAWCIEPNQFLTSPNSWDLVDLADAPIAGPGNPMGGTRATDLGKLFGGVGYDWNLGVAGSPTTHLDLTQQANRDAFQLAIWEIGNETENTYDVGEGTFKVLTGATSAVINTANDLLNNLSGYTEAANLYALTNADKQDYLVQVTIPSGVNPVPLPAAAWLFLSAMGGTLVVGRRRRKGQKS